MTSYLSQETNSPMTTDDGTFNYKPRFPFVYLTNTTKYNSSLLGRYLVTPLFIILGPLIATFRITTFILLQSVVTLCSIIILLGYPKDQPLRGWRITLYKCVAYPAYFIMLCTWGVFYTIDDRKRAKRPVICVSNHVSFLDIFGIIMAEGPAFVSKVGVSRISLLKKPMEALRVIYVRVKRDQKDKAGDKDNLTSTELLKERVEKMKTDADWRPIHIFPEGTTTTEEGVLRFRTSVFRLDTGIQPICLMYQSYNNPAYISQNAFKALYSCLTNPFCVIRMVYLDPVHSRTPAGEPKDPRAFADEVGAAIAKHIGAEYLPYTNDDAFYFRRKIKDASRCSTEYVRDYMWIGTHLQMNVLDDPAYTDLGHKHINLREVFVGDDKQYRKTVLKQAKTKNQSVSMVKQKKDI